MTRLGNSAQPGVAAEKSESDMFLLLDQKPSLKYPKVFWFIYVIS